MDIYLIIFNVGMFFLCFIISFFPESLLSDQVHFQLVWFMIFYLEAKLFRFIEQIHFPVGVFELNVEHTTFFGNFYLSNVIKTIHCVLFYMFQYPLLSYGLKLVTKYTENNPTCRSPTDPLGIIAQHYAAKNYCSTIRNTQKTAQYVEAQQTDNSADTLVRLGHFSLNTY